MLKLNDFFNYVIEMISNLICANWAKNFENIDSLYIVGLINALEHKRFEKLRYILY